jgi:hypothetical protein
MTRSSHHTGFRRLPRTADQMTPDLRTCVARAYAAERAGDLSAALEWHQAVPMFRRGRHRTMLERLSLIGPDLPEWVWARWIVYQAIRCEDGDLGHVGRQVLGDLMSTVHADLVERCHDEGGDPVRVAARVMGESWFFHQAVAHEVGGLAAFLDEFATGALAEHGELARQWDGTRLGGYQLGESLDGGRVQVRWVDGTEWLEALDIGARSCADAHGFVLGRLVPSGVDDLLMFEMPPLAVPESVAREVSRAPGDRAAVQVALAVDDGVLAPARLLREDYELTTDVLELDLVRFGTQPGDVGRVMSQLRAGRDESSRAAYRILRRARDGEIDPADQAYVAAAALFPKAHDDARRRLVRPGDHGAWSAWAERATDPSRRRLLALAEAARASA